MFFFFCLSASLSTSVCASFTAGAGTNGDTPTGTQQVVAKLLVSNPIAGSVIGKVRQA